MRFPVFRPERNTYSSAAHPKHYAFAFEITSANEVPALEVEEGHFRRALFLPRDDPDWFGRISYPARLLLLTDDTSAVPDLLCDTA